MPNIINVKSAKYLWGLGLLYLEIWYSHEETVDNQFRPNSSTFQAISYLILAI